jgi:hypothetical protein
MVLCMPTTRVLAFCVLIVVTCAGAMAWRGSLGTAGETRPKSEHGHTSLSTNSFDVPPVPRVLEYIPTYFEHVKPILEANCVSCHSAGGIAPFELDSFESVKINHRAVYMATRARIMPPFPPGGESPRFHNEHRLSDDEIAVLANWSWAGALAGAASKARTAEPRIKLTSIRDDMTLRLTRAFQTDKAVSDEYRCFVLDPKLEQERFVTGYEVLPSNRKLVHHVLIYELEAKLQSQADRLMRDETDGRDGYTCFGASRVDDTVVPFAGWASGTSGVRFPKGVGMRLKPGSKLIMQVHYNLANGAQSDQSALRLEFAAKDAKLTPVINFAINAPVEIPCPGAYPSDPNDACHREAAYKRVFELNDSASARTRLAGTTLKRCQRTVEEFINPQDPTRIETWCDYAVPFKIKLLGAAGHMHYLGRSVKVEVNPGTAKRRVLLDIPRWDFHWQNFYWLEEPAVLKSGDVVRMTCVFDNSPAKQPFIGGAQRKPRYVVWGESSDEEMCLGFTQAILGN